jgi:hypothetical protein
MAEKSPLVRQEFPVKRLPNDFLAGNGEGYR